MTATSGPGFSLMQENLGFACMAEVPCVVVNVMRGGPSTGLPTNPAQGDVMQARWGTHGDHPIIVLCASSVLECFTLTVKAFNLSERYRTPVILLLDEVVAHMREKVVLPKPSEVEIVDRVKPSVPPEWYLPYEDTSFGVPPMGIFGEGYRYHVTGLTHDIRGFPTLRQDEIEPFLLPPLPQDCHPFRRTSRLVEHFMTEDAEIGRHRLRVRGPLRPAGRPGGPERRDEGGPSEVDHPLALPAAVVEIADQGGQDRAGPGDEHGPDLPRGEAGQPGNDPGLDPEQDRRHDHQPQRDSEGHR